MKQHYVNAILSLIKDGNNIDAVMAGFSRALKARGHQRLYRGVLRSVLRELSAARPDLMVVARNEQAYEAEKNAIANALNTLNVPVGSVPVVRYDDTIIGGVIVEHKARRLDQSYKQRLLKIYRSLTA